MWIFFQLKKSCFILSGLALTPPPLSGRATKKGFFSGFPSFVHIFTQYFEYLTFLLIQYKKKAKCTKTVDILLTIQKILIGVSCCGSQNQPQPPIFKYQIRQNQNSMVFFLILFSLSLFLIFFKLSFFISHFFFLPELE